MTDVDDRLLTGMSDADRVRLLQPPPGPVSMVLDTDTANEIDDQFALAYALLATDRVSLEAIYAAPFSKRGATGPADGMRRSYDEILRIIERAGNDRRRPVFHGATRWMTAPDTPVDSPATADLVVRARASADPLYVVAIGAPTNIASALVAAPDIAPRVVVVWLGGNPSYWHRAVEFNVGQDMTASRVLLDSGVPLVHVPCRNVTEHLRTTLAEVDRFVRSAGPLGACLAELFEGHFDDHFARSKVIWDLGAVAWVVGQAWAPSHVLHSPLLTTEGTWSHDPGRHLIREVSGVDRDSIFADFFRRLHRHIAE